jgi:predicted DCC family thiol-disulfide oxidoreductase YuxK
MKIAYYKVMIVDRPVSLNAYVDSSIIQKLGITYADGLKILHAQDSNGKLHMGVDAFLLIWRKIPGWRLLAIIVDIPIIRLIVGLSYICCMEIQKACALSNSTKSR